MTTTKFGELNTIKKCYRYLLIMSYTNVIECMVNSHFDEKCCFIVPKKIFSCV